MSNLDVQLFVAAVNDIETAKYRVLHALKEVKSFFQQNEIYPYLEELVGTYRSLKSLAEGTDSLRNALPKEIESIDPESGKLSFRWPELEQDEMESVRELINWALPEIESVIEEGSLIYDFVDEHLHLQEVGLIPSYKEEGYVMLPEIERKSLHVLRYQLSIFTGSNENYRSLRISPLKQIKWLKTKPPQEIKLELIAEHEELPNPATFFFDPELEFPFKASVMPVAKRKLMRHLSGSC